MVKNCSALLLFLWLFLPLSADGAAAAETRSGPLHAALRQGVESVFNLDHAGASAAFQRVVENDREGPTGFAFLAVAHLFFYETAFDPQERGQRREEMLRCILAAVVRAERRLARNPLDGHSLFALAVARMVKVRLAIGQRSYLLAAQESLLAWHDMEKAREADPANDDVYFLRGLLHYHLDQLPGGVRLLSSLLMTAGNRHQGLQELERAMLRGDYLRELAQAELASVYAHFEKQPALALPLAADLRERFPGNPHFAFSLAGIYSELRRFDEAQAIARELEKGIRGGVLPRQLQLRHDHLLGTILFHQGQYARAGGYFQRVARDTAPCNARIRAAALLRMGMICDLQGERKQAEDCYRRALEVEGGEGIAQVEARQYLRTPYSALAKGEGSAPVRTGGQRVALGALQDRAGTGDAP